jgi:hypothetical protein
MTKNGGYCSHYDFYNYFGLSILFVIKLHKALGILIFGMQILKQVQNKQCIDHYYEYQQYDTMNFNCKRLLSTPKLEFYL